jgi:endogenous inhibitor of DNA gyrase (YacG/DUF329 family)
MIDLGNWLDGRYTLADDSDPPPDSPPQKH